jgi:hypothetical protein
MNRFCKVVYWVLQSKATIKAKIHVDTIDTHSTFGFLKKI